MHLLVLLATSCCCTSPDEPVLTIAGWTTHHICLQGAGGSVVQVAHGQVLFQCKLGAGGQPCRLQTHHTRKFTGTFIVSSPEPFEYWRSSRKSSSESMIAQYYYIDIQGYLKGWVCTFVTLSTAPGSYPLNIQVYICLNPYIINYFQIGCYVSQLIHFRNVIILILQLLAVNGFLSTGDDEIPGNFGLRDQNLAIQWVKNNIEHFGGASSKITLFGESAGGVSVHMQILSPYSKDLFSRAIMQSGNALIPFAKRNDHASVALRVGNSLHCPGVTKESITGGTDLLTCLQSANATQLVTLYTEYQTLDVAPLLFVPCVDGDFLPAAPEVLLRQGIFNRVDIISGITRDEGALITKRLY
ncbi:unnamed protein product, partial [Meganyctiphanes norvegica]